MHKHDIWMEYLNPRLMSSISSYSSRTPCYVWGGGRPDPVGDVRSDIRDSGPSGVWNLPLQAPEEEEEESEEAEKNRKWWWASQDYTFMFVMLADALCLKVPGPVWQNWVPQKPAALKRTRHRLQHKAELKSRIQNKNKVKSTSYSKLACHLDVSVVFITFLFFIFFFLKPLVILLSMVWGTPSLQPVKLGM